MQEHVLLERSNRWRLGASCDPPVAKTILKSSRSDTKGASNRTVRAGDLSVIEFVPSVNVCMHTFGAL